MISPFEEVSSHVSNIASYVATRRGRLLAGVGSRFHVSYWLVDGADEGAVGVQYWVFTASGTLLSGLARPPECPEWQHPK